jgi:hypothetical protein
MSSGTNVNQSWKEYDLVAYTPSITVGVNFTDFKYFDKKYFIGYNSCTVRDSIQALDRCRKTKTEELVIHFLNDYSNKVKFMKSRDKAIESRFSYESKELQRLRKIYKISNRQNYLRNNDWYSYIKLYNEKERRQTDAAYKKVFMYYLNQLNYDVFYDDTILKEEEKNELEKLECDIEYDFEKIETILSKKEFDKIQSKIKNNKASEYEKTRLNKEYMLRRFYYGENFKNKVDNEEIKKLWSFWRNGYQQSKLKRLQDELIGKLKTKFEESLKSDTNRLKTINCYPEIMELYEKLGISNSADNEKIFRTEDFEKKKETLQPIINKLFKKLNIRDYNKYKTFKYSEGVKIKNEINKILKSWTGSSFKLHKRITENKKKWSLFCIENMTSIDKNILKNA